MVFDWQFDMVELCRDKLGIFQLQDVISLDLADLKLGGGPGMTLGVVAKLKAIWKHFNGNKETEQDQEPNESQQTNPDWMNEEQDAQSEVSRASTGRAETWTKRLSSHKLRHPLLPVCGPRPVPLFLGTAWPFPLTR